MNLQRRLESHTFRDDYGHTVTRLVRLLRSKVFITLAVVAALYLAATVAPIYHAPEVEESHQAELVFSATTPEMLAAAYFPSATNLDELVASEKERIEARGTPVNAPYSVSGLVLWPDNVESRALGAVVETKSGFRIYNFSGWVKFSDNRDSIVYKYKDGLHTELKYRSAENAYYVDSDDEVQVYSGPLQQTHLLRFWDNEIFLDDNWLGKTVGFLIPDFPWGVVSCRKMAVEDTMWRTGQFLTNEAVPVVLPDNLAVAIGEAGNALADLQQLYASLDDGYTVAVCLYDQHEYALFSIYGYSGNTFFVGDTSSGAPQGYLTVRVAARQTNDGNEKYWEFEDYPDKIVTCIAQNRAS